MKDWAGGDPAGEGSRTTAMYLGSQVLKIAKRNPKFDNIF